MATKSNKPDALTVDMHVYMTERDREALREWAKEECRSMNAQLLVCLRQAVARRTAMLSPLDDPEIERIRNAGRNDRWSRHQRRRRAGPPVKPAT